jgi:signal transduction histidine kinase
MALGAVAAWLGMGSEAGGGYLFPALVGVSAVLAGIGLLFRGNRRPAGIGSFSSVSSVSSACSLATRNGAEAEAAGSALLGHEMKNYLCTLKGNARLLRNRMPGDDQAIIDRIDRVVEKLESFTRRIGTGEAATGLGALKPMPPSQAAEACVRTHFHKRLDAFRFCEDSAAPALLCDPGRLEQVFLNLFANSLEAGAGRIETSVRSEGRRLIVRIEDDGRGCEPDDLARIFEPFYTTKTGPVRRGLGMFIVQSIVENHGGSVRVTSKNGSPGGSTGLVFTLDFPQPSRVGVPLRPIPLVAATASVEEEWMLNSPLYHRP